MPRAFNLQTRMIVSPAGNEYPALQLGEFGRGRRGAIVPCAVVNDGDGVAVVPTKTGLPRIVSAEPSEDWLLRVSTKEQYVRGAYGYVTYWPGGPKPLVIARAYGAFGDAGRTGVWYDYLLQCPIGTILRVGYTRNRLEYWHCREDKVVVYTNAELARLDDLATGRDLYSTGTLEAIDWSA